MKKALSLLLALLLVFSMNAAVFAETDPLTQEELEDMDFDQTGSTTLTATVPENTVSYVMHIPANTNLTYGNADRQLLGDLYVSNVTSSRNTAINCYIVGTDLTNGNSVIPVTYGFTTNADTENPSSWYSFSGIAPMIQLFAIYDGIECGSTYHLCAAVSAASWAAAAPGTYTATLNFNFEVTDYPS